jgi:hypothetical protein
MGRWKKRLFLALILVLLLVSTFYYLGSGFLGRKAQVERERLLVRKHIETPLESPEAEGEEVARERGQEGLMSLPPKTPSEEVREARLKELEARIRQLEQELLTKERGIEDWKRRWEQKSRELKRYNRELLALKKETIRRERKPLVQKPPVGEEVRVEAEGQEKRAVRLLRATTVAECEGVSMSHRDLALFLSRWLRLGPDLSYSKLVTALYGVGISPRAGWSQADPSIPIGADELEEILSKAQKAISIGLVAAHYPELKDKLRQYCEKERAQMVESPQCEGPMVTECEDCDISHGDFAIYLCKVLGIGEALNYDQSFLALTALQISPKRGWRSENPLVPITHREMEEVRCSVQEAYEKGLISTEPTLMVASVNDLCLWLKTDIEVVGAGAGIVAEAMAQSGYQGGTGEVPSVPSASQ